MTKMKNRHFSTTHRPHHHHLHHPPPLPPQHHHHYFPHLPPRPLLHHHHQAQAQAQAQPQPNYPSYETTLIEEVLYLHSLWHRGPPSHTPSGPTTSTSPYLKPTRTTHFKKPIPVSDKEWPVPEVGPVSDSGSEWPAFRVLNNPITRPATEEEKAKVLGVRVQMRGVEAASCLFRKRNEDGEEEEVEEDEDEEDDGDDEEEIDFFENLFEEDVELKEFYVRNCGGEGNGEFCCLVCGVGGGWNLGRKFKNCVALVQHSITVSKTKRRKAHRAYGNVVCKVLGWDVHRLPSLPLDVGISQSVEKPCEVMKGEVKNDADGGSADVEVERNAALAEPSQTEMEIVPDARETENVTSTAVGCTAAESIPGLVEVKSHDDQGSTVVEMEKDASLAKSNLPETEIIPDSLQKENGTSTDAGYIPKEQTHGLEINDPELDQEEVVNKNEEGCPVLESKPVERESAVVEDDPFEQLPSLPGAFQIPE